MKNPPPNRIPAMLMESLHVLSGRIGTVNRLGTPASAGSPARPPLPAKSASEYLFLGGTGDPPVPSGDSPDGTEVTLRSNQRDLPAKLLSTVPVGKLPTGAGESPAPPIFQTRSKAGVPQRLMRRAFTLIEILVTVALLSFIIIGLLLMFSQTQRAFMSSMTQTDMLEAGRGINDGIVNDMSDIAAADLPNTLNFYADFDYGTQPIVTGLIGSQPVRSNLLQKVYFLTQNNLQWTAIGYQVVPYYTDATGVGYGPGALYRFTTNITRYVATPFTAALTNVNTRINNNNFNFAGTTPNNIVFVTSNKIADGVVDFRVRAFATNGWPITSDSLFFNRSAQFRQMNLNAAASSFYVTNTSTVAFMNNAFAALRPWPASGSTPVVAEPMYYAFWSNALPAQIELEFGVVEPRILQHYQAIGQANEAAQLQYLSNHAAEIHIFRQRIPVGSVDPYAY
jgi:hypothetical protein